MMVTEQNKTEPQMEENETRMCDCREQNLYNSPSIVRVFQCLRGEEKGSLFSSSHFLHEESISH